MDEKLIKKDTSQLWTETDSLSLTKSNNALPSSKGQWLTGAAIVLGISILLFVLFNTRSK
jgi:hypothetical protein